MKIRSLVKSEAYSAPMTEVLSVVGESIIAASDKTIGADSWTDGNSNWCD